ncbi:MarR family transcriptional regulator [Streptomyces violascens]|uniref:MarR family transcriptional regulator n=1 Tax=Streptomyces violascens TaxID=67381 RepID=UPI0037B4CF8B
MAKAARKVLALVDEETGQYSEVQRAAYAFDGPHINVGIRKGRQLASGASGLTDRQYRVLSWYWFATEQSQGPVTMTGTDIAKELGLSPDSLSRTVKFLKKHRLLVEAGGIGRTTFYRTTPYLAFIGTGFEHREAVKEWNPPELTVAEPRSRRRKKTDEEGDPS